MYIRIKKRLKYKTKMVWIECKNEMFRHSILKLESSNIDLLGIKFSINLPEMINLNYKTIFIKVRNIINQWKQRKLTSIGRLVVIKT